MPWFKDEIAKAFIAKIRRLKYGADKMIGINQFARPDIRKAEILPHPKFTPKTGSTIETDSFAEAIHQAKNGLIVPVKAEKMEFESVRFADSLETESAQ